MEWEWPQYAMAGLFFVELWWQSQRHGKPREHPHDFPASLFATGIVVGILYFGGFWT